MHCFARQIDRPWKIGLLFAAVAILGGCCRNACRPQHLDVHELIQEAIDHSASQPRSEDFSSTICQPPDPEMPLSSTAVALVSDEELLPFPQEKEQNVVGGESEKVLLSEEFVESDIREAIILLAELAKEEVVLDEQVRGVINTSLIDVTFEQALSKLLLPLGFVFAKHNGQYLIAPPDPKSPMFPLIAKQFEYQPLHLPAKALINTTPKSMRAFVQLVDSSNTLQIDAPEQYGRLLLKRYARLDQPVPQVELEAIICVVSPDCGFRFGINWGHAVELDGKSAFDLGMSGLALSGKLSPTGFNAIFQDFATTSFFIRRLAEHGYLTIRAAPRVVAKDGEQASISINRETFFTVQPFSDGSNGDNNAFFFQQDIQKVESGISLDITPKIRGEVVTIEIAKAEVSEDIRNANTENAVNPFPIINRRSVSTTVHVENKKTIVIGGLVQRETVDRVNQVPGLSKVPVIGRLFKNNQSQIREAEVVIFISPRIIRNGETATATLHSQATTTSIQ